MALTFDQLASLTDGAISSLLFIFNCAFMWWYWDKCTNITLNILGVFIDCVDIVLIIVAAKKKIKRHNR